MKYQPRNIRDVLTSMHFIGCVHL